MKVDVERLSGAFQDTARAMDRKVQALLRAEEGWSERLLEVMVRCGAGALLAGLQGTPSCCRLACPSFAASSPRPQLPRRPAATPASRGHSSCPAPPCPQVASRAGAGSSRAREAAAAEVLQLATAAGGEVVSAEIAAVEALAGQVGRHLRAAASWTADVAATRRGCCRGADAAAC